MADQGLHRENNRFSSAEIGALAHLYRAEVYRSTLWRSRLDTTTNWSVVTLGIAISVSFSAKEASPVPLVLVGLLVLFFLLLEARRYRYFNVWRARARWIETNFYSNMLTGNDRGSGSASAGWQDVLAADYERPKYHISYLRAVGRRLRRNYLWILVIQAIAYVGKLLVHPTPATSLDDVFARARIGEIPGEFMLSAGAFYLTACLAIAGLTLYLDRVTHGGERTTVSGG